MPLTLTPAAENFRLTESKPWARCMKLTRRDGTIIRTTTHDLELPVLTDAAAGTFETFSPVRAPMGSSWKRQTGLSSETGELKGALGLYADAEDFRQGLFREALVDLYDVNWRFPWAGYLRKRSFFVDEVKWSGTRYEIKLASLASRLDVRVGRIMNRDCDAELGDARCTVNLTGLGSGTRSVTQVAGLTEGDDIRTRFYSSATGFAADYFKLGKLEWLTGNNAITSLQHNEVKAYDPATGYIEMALPTPHDIQVGDTFRAWPGCGKELHKDCRKRFNNAINHRGFHYMVPAEIAFKTPNP